MTTANQVTPTNGSESSNAIPGVRLTVFVPLKTGDLVMNVFKVEAVNTLAWFRSHADELANLCMPGAQYTALNLEPLPV